ncbi:TPA: restriction endonuclease subunit S [Escherichia coli]|uniref:restriction endonuclease subunit S n=1 Tax=Escherichia coli TaxID=562 RepID=UPI000A9E680B|nr:restriction endonuclease subunit S [Escherichia coli]EHR2696688.1 restriction endonuclease subunit S [Escherichia coli]EIP0438686.1 restriction endonuclease subunit S [Escherichia coli]EIQ0900762.1 restriction endonuclease subunit S [Escherichia coli]EIQ2114909.1 restriction endonuclease subunit S [Escherichia coli]EIY2833444.1 restriction endonuclease subunit S [Escherichia coli]
MGSKITLAEICTDISYGYTASATAKPVGPKFLRITDIQGGKVNWENVPYCEIDEKDSLKYLLQDGDIVIARTGNSTGENFIFSSNTKVVFASYLIRFRIDPKKANPKFIWLQMRTPQWWSFIDSVKTGSAQAGANAKVLGLYEVELPERKIQDHIADIGFNLLKKQDINSKINQTLEQMSQTLFKSWFVDFDPVIDNALDAGNPIPEALQTRTKLRQKVRNSADFKPLPAEIRSLFPSEFEETELGWVPKGWKEGTLPEIAFINSTSWTNKNQPDYINYVDLSNAKDGRIYSIEKLSFNDAPSRARRILKKDDLIFGLVRPANRSFAYVHVDGLTGSTGFAVIRAQKTIYKNFIYYFVTYDKNIEELARIADGGAYPAIKPDDICTLPLIIPSINIIEKFDELTSNFREMMNNSLIQNEYLTNLRGTLLPKLISGELSLEDLPDLTTDTEAA